MKPIVSKLDERNEQNDRRYGRTTQIRIIRLISEITNKTVDVKRKVAVLWEELDIKNKNKTSFRHKD